MATNVFFQNYGFFNEQQLIDDLVIESIQIYGIDLFYVSRSLQAVDNILNEDDLSIFDKAYNLEMYVKSVDGFEGEGDFLSRFGLQIRDSVTFTVAVRTFERFVTQNDANKVRPLEGDIIYFPLNNKFFEIMHVEHESVFYQTGALQVFDLKCELLEYSNQRFETGLTEIDTYFNEIDSDTESTLEGLNTKDNIAKNLYFEEEGDNIIDFTELDPFSEALSVLNKKPTADDTSYMADSTLITVDRI